MDLGKLLSLSEKDFISTLCTLCTRENFSQEVFHNVHKKRGKEKVDSYTSDSPSDSVTVLEIIWRDKNRSDPFPE